MDLKDQSHLTSSFLNFHSSTDVVGYSEVFRKMPANLPPRRRAPTPDIMNDSIYDVRPKSKSKNVEEMDTCRICRGEGSKEEPLFYPCKCNGSIKFVHQNCLMEWLSHSQKKHCELCKTPFRFTKLYHPHMPSTVPLLIFLRQAAVQSWKTFLTWSRFHLVLFVWIAWLPWCMRTVWRGLFWIGDGGWINWQKMEEQAFAAAQKRLDKLAAEGISPANAPLMSSKHTAASAVVSQVANALPHFLSPISQTFNATGGAPSVVRLAKTLIMGLIGGNSSDSATFSLSRTNDTNASPPTQRSPSWLSGLRFLRYLTRSHTMNNLIIDTLEGQLITLIVVITFILVFLIREWVVQQQPGMNIGAAPNAIPGVIQPPEAPAERIADQPVEQRRQPLPEPEGTAEAEADATPRELDPEPRIMARPTSKEVIAQMTDDDPYENIRSQGQDLRTADTAAAENASANLNLEDVTTEETLDAGSEQPLRKVSIRDPPNPSQRPSMPTRYALARATEIRRTLEEQSKASGHKDWPGLKIFMELWNRAESKPSEVLRIIEEEGRHEELSWIVAAMRKLENASSIDDDHGDKPSAIVGPSKDSLPDARSVEGENYKISDSQGRAKYPNAHPALETEAQQSATDSKTVRDIDNIVDSVRSQSSNVEDCSVVDIATARDSEGKSLFLQALEGSDIAQDPEIHSSWSNAGWPRDWDHFSNQSGSVGSSRGEVRATPSPPENLDSDAEIANDPNAEFDNTSQEAAPQGPQDVAVVHQNLADTVFNWLWGEVDPQVNPPIENTDQEGGDDEQIVNNLADEAPFVPVGNHRPIIEEAEIAENAEAEENAEDENPVQDQGLLAAAVQAEVEPNGADAPEEGEELEGIMELVGMQGPLAGLIQNGMFCAVLVSVTMFLSMWIPYIAGKMFLVFLANPVSLLLKAPLRWASASADLIIDLGIFSASCAFYWVDTAMRILCAPIGWIIPSLKNISQNKILAETAKEYAENAMERLAKILVATGGSLSESDIPTFSIIAHESLRLIEYRTAYMMQLIHIAIGTVVKFTQYHTHDYKGVFTFMINSIVANASDASDLVAYKVREMKMLSPASFRFNPLHISLSIPQRVTPLDYSLAYWDTKDRMLAIMFGYLFFAFMGMSYLKFSVFFWGKNGRGRVDGAFADILYQAGGVLKVILIISIEMIVFPLYCGLLLDVALLPLFGNVTIISRLNFLINSPSTSLFVHWFVGTCYMFHFALFVSLCRKIMRKGVLCKSTSV